jgi:molybdopterin biosynthesis enzyme MoaB
MGVATRRFLARDLAGFGDHFHAVSLQWTSG